MNELKKINKAQARKLIEAGSTVYMLPNKVRIGNMWIQPYELNQKYLNENDITLEKFINQYKYYNCSYNELGYEIAWYANESEVTV